MHASGEPLNENTAPCSAVSIIITVASHTDLLYVIVKWSVSAITGFPVADNFTVAVPLFSKIPLALNE